MIPACMLVGRKKELHLHMFANFVYEPISATDQFTAYVRTEQQLGETPEFKLTFNIHFLNILIIMFF